MQQVNLEVPHLFDDPEWQACAEDYLLSRFDKSESAGTFRIYRMHLQRFFVDPTRVADDYTPHEVSRFLRSGNGKDGQPVASATFNQRLAVLHGLFRAASTYCVKRNGRREPLFSGIAPTANLHFRKPARNYKALTSNEVERFFQAIADEMVESIARIAKQRYGLSFDRAKFLRMDANHQCGYIKQLTTHCESARRAMMHPFIVDLRDKSLFWLFLTSARRRDELRLLQWQDIESTTFVEHGIARPGYLFRFHGKGHAAQRDACEMAESAYRLIERYLTLSGRMESIEPTDYVFAGIPRASGGGRPAHSTQPLAESSLQNSFRRYANRAAISPAKTIHSWRHTSARLRYESGADIRSIQRTLRHSSLATTSHYLDELISPPDPEAILIETKFSSLMGSEGQR